MSLLQIRSLKAPEEIRRGSLHMTGAQSTTASGNASYNERDEGVFTCYFGRPVAATDYPQPATPGGVASINITVNVYDNLGVFVNSMTLNATQANIRNNNGQYYTCFKLFLSDADFRRLGGGSIYVHVVIDDSAENVSFRVGFTGNYHETIKHVQIYDEKSVESVCWSIQSYIPDNGVSIPCPFISLTQDAYIHIRTRGLCGETVVLKIYERGLDSTILATIDTPVYYNRKVVVVSMKYLLACYCRASRTTYNPGDAISLNFYVTAEYIAPVAAIPVFRLQTPWTENPYLKESANLQLIGSADSTAPNRANNGTVFAQVGEGEVRIVGPERYRDFLIGYMCHVEGIGKLVDRNNNTSNVSARRVTVYPLHTYEIMLSDLVACGIITLDEAIYMAPVANPERTRTPAKILQERNQLQKAFNKTIQRLSGNATDLLINRFLDNTYRFNGANQRFANSEAIRTLLAQIQHKPEVFGTVDNEALHYICRDAWQDDSVRATTRYDARQECPFGEFFLNYITANFKLFVGRYYSNADINQYDAQENIRPISPNQNNGRDAIAFHQGASFASIGCLTFNKAWDKRAAKGAAQKRANNYSSFNNILYPNRQNINKLNFVCIDERNAINPANDRRYHDLVRHDEVLA